jgi:hypothetical protein
MKPKILVLTLVVVMGMALYPLEGKAQMGRGYGGGSGGYGMMGQGSGCGAGSGMMGYGYGPGPQYGPQYGPRYGPRYQQPQRPMEEEDAMSILENYLKSTRNPNLKLGKMEDKGHAFEAEIVTKKEEALVDKIAVDKYTGRTRSIY